MKMLRCPSGLAVIRRWRPRPKFRANTLASTRVNIRLDNTRRGNIPLARGARFRASPARLARPAVTRTGQPQPESRGKRSNSEAQLLTTTSGILRRVAPNQLVIQPDDHRVVWYRLAPQLKVQKDGKDADLKDFALGDYLSVDSNSDDDSIMTAVSVTWKKAATPDDRAEASKTGICPGSKPSRAVRPSLRPIPTRRRPRRRGSLAMSAPSFAARIPSPASAPQAEAAPEPKTAKETASGSAPPKQEEPDNTPPPTVMRPPDPKPDADDPGRRF